MSNTCDRGPGLSVAVLAALILAPAQVHAQDTELRLGAGATFSDNIDLAPSGQEESDLVLYVVPGISMSREGGRAAFTLDYRLEGLVYMKNSDSNATFHQLNALGTAELIAESLYLDTDVSYGQQLIAPRRELGADLISRPDDFSDVLTYRLSPYVQPRFGAHAEAELRYQYEVNDYRDDTELDSESNQVNLRVAGSRAFQRFDWVLRYDREKIDYDDDTSDDFEIYTGLLQINPTEQFSVFVEAGRENNDFEGAGESSQPSGNLWRVGAIWTPTTRTRIEGFYADRYYGSYFGGSLRHRTSSSTWAFDYEEEPTTGARLLSDSAGSPEFGNIEQPFLDEAGNPVFNDSDFPITTTEAFLRRRATLAVQGQRSRIDWGIRVFREERDFEFSERNETETGAGFNLGYRLGPRTRLIGNYDWLRTEGQDDPGTEHGHLVRLGLVHDISPRTVLVAGYRFVDNDGVEGGGVEGGEEPYRENRVTLFFTTLF